MAKIYNGPGKGSESIAKVKSGPGKGSKGEGDNPDMMGHKGASGAYGKESTESGYGKSTGGRKNFYW